MVTTDYRESLAALGFTELEVAVYVFLLGESPATGYRVAQAIGKPVANTYKALQSLQAKGAVVAEDGTGKFCRAVAVEDLLGQLERRFQEHRRRVGLALTRLKPNVEDHRVYQLHTPAQVLERCRRMLAACRHSAIVDAFPRTLEELRPAIEKAAARGVTIAVQAYQPTRLVGVEVTVRPEGDAVQRRWPGQWLNVVTEGREFVLAFLTEDLQAVHQAVWSGSAYLSWVYHSAVSAEVVLGELSQLIEGNAPPATLRHALRRYRNLCRTDLPGSEELIRRFGGTSPIPSTKKRKRTKGAS